VANKLAAANLAELARRRDKFVFRVRESPAQVATATRRGEMGRLNKKRPASLRGETGFDN
jgi:hypothetical protein